MKDHDCTVDRFLKDVAQHTMTVVRDDGVNRHIRFKKPDSSTYWFDLITWPGALCIDGDCGTYVFKRLDDMFQFFRTDREYHERNGRQLAINPSYWGEKIVSMSRFGGYEEFDGDRFSMVVKEYFAAWVEDKAPSDEAKADVWRELEDEVLCMANEHQVRAMDAAIGFSSSEHGFQMEDFWDHNFMKPTFQYIWCIYAIAWGVKTYDQSKATPAAA